jgi:hypothetical protein
VVVPKNVLETPHVGNWQRADSTPYKPLWSQTKTMRK